MKFLHALFSMSMLVLIALSACAPQTSSPTAAPNTNTSSTGVPTTENVQPVSLIEPKVSSTMLWVDGSTLVYVPSGDFIMGTNGGKDNPQHIVTLDGFWIYQSKVTNREYALCAGVGKCQPPIDPQAAKDLRDATLLDHPVVGVDWSQSQTYCNWVQGVLPTEAQWEKTARGPSGNTYPWGADKPSATLLNFNDNIGKTSRVSDYIKGQSYYSAFDTEGNVFEWVSDWYKPDYYGTSPQKNPLGPDTGTERSVRSSSFSSTKDQTPAYTRFSFTPDKNRPDLGFRCVVDHPTAFAPYCQTSQISGPSTCTTPTAVQNGASCDAPNGLAGAKVSGGVIQSVTTSPPLKCAYQGQVILCQGPQSTTGKVTVCAQTCSAGALSCPAGYSAVTDHQGEIYCANDGGPICVAGTPGCASLPASDPGNHNSNGNSNNNGNSNSNNNGNSNSNNNGINQVSPGNTVACIQDKDNRITCKPLDSTTPNQCLPGYTYNQGCCQAPAGGQYPGCGANEYYDPASQTCLAVGKPSPGSCITFSVTTGACKTGGSCQPPAGGCMNPNGLPGNWDQASCSCK